MQEGDCLEDLGLKWQDNIEMDLKGMRWMSVEWIDIAQDWDKQRSVLKTVTKIWVP